MYTVNITRSIDGYTPTGQAKLYCLGTTDEFVSRMNMKKGETYIIDASRGFTAMSLSICFRFIPRPTRELMLQAW